MVGKFSNEHITAYRVPLHDEDPTEEMIEWMNSSPLSWDGDESGICFYELGYPETLWGSIPDLIAAPGDWIVHIHSGNQWVVLPDAAVQGLVDLQAKLAAVNADAERLAEALGLLAIATGKQDCGGKVAHALAAHEARKGGA